MITEIVTKCMQNTDTLALESKCYFLMEGITHIQVNI